MRQKNRLERGRHTGFGNTTRLWAAVGRAEWNILTVAFSIALKRGNEAHITWLANVPTGCLSPADVVFVTLRAMESPFPLPSLTRFDVVMWFLRVQMWLLLVTAIARLLTSVVYFFAPIGSPFFAARLIAINTVPVLILLVFPAVLASSVLGSTARDCVTSVSDVKPLASRCLGLALFVGSLGQLVVFFGAVAYYLVTHNPMLGFPMPGLATGVGRLLALGQLVEPTISFFLGFALAFGPAIRDSFRAR